MIRDIEAARDALADALWWFKGFAAARPPSIDEGAGEHRDLERKIGDVREFLTSINRASIRRMGEETAIVLSFAEFERIADAIRGYNPVERMSAIQTVETVFAEYSAEEKRHREDQRNPNIPF